MRIGELLISLGKLTEEQLEQALEAQKWKGGKLGTNLVEMGLISEKELATILARQLKVKAAEKLEFESISADVLNQVSAEFAGKHHLIPLSLGSKLKVAISDPRDIAAVDELSFKLGKGIEVVVAPEIWVTAALERYYGIARDVRISGAIEIGDPFYGEITHNIAEPLEIEPQTETAGNFISLREFGQKIVSGQNSAEIINPLFAYLSDCFPRLAAYAVRNDNISGWFVHGFPLTLSRFSEVSVKLRGEGSFSQVVNNRTKFVGKLPTNQENFALSDILGVSFQQLISLYPIVVRERVIAILLAVAREDRLTLDTEQQQRVEQAIELLQNAFELLYLARLIKRQSGVDL